MSSRRRPPAQHHYSPPPRGSDRLNILLGILVVVVIIVCVIVLRSDKIALPDNVTEGAKSVATSVAPGIFPPTAEQAAREADFKCRVVKINDGDTLRCQDGTRVRLHAISARERDNSCSPGHPCSQTSADQATRILSQLVAGKMLDCMTTGQSYDRVTAICWTAARVEVNCYMVETGAAELWERFDNETRICRDKRSIGSLRQD